MKSRVNDIYINIRLSLSSPADEIIDSPSSSSSRLMKHTTVSQTSEESLVESSTVTNFFQPNPTHIYRLFMIKGGRTISSRYEKGSVAVDTLYNSYFQASYIEIDIQFSSWLGKSFETSFYQSTAAEYIYPFELIKTNSKQFLFLKEDVARNWAKDCQGKFNRLYFFLNFPASHRPRFFRIALLIALYIYFSLSQKKGKAIHIEKLGVRFFFMMGASLLYYSSGLIYSFDCVP